MGFEPKMGCMLDFGSIAILCAGDEIGAYTLGFLSRIADFQPKQQSKTVISQGTDAPCLSLFVVTARTHRREVIRDYGEAGRVEELAYGPLPQGGPASVRNVALSENQP